MLAGTEFGEISRVLRYSASASSKFPSRINCWPCLINSGCCCWLPGVCASRAREAERTRKARGITAMVAFMGRIISQSRSPDVSDPPIGPREN